VPPNILLIVLDAARRDALEPYGAPAGSTPAIASLARRGHALARAYATSSWTLPSHASLFTGRLPRGLGLGQAPGRTPDGARATLRALESELLPSVLRKSGYRTHGFSANLWASGHAGFDTGFDTFAYRSGGRNERLNALPGGRIGGRLAWALEGARARADDGAAAIGRELRASIAAAQAGQPSFWFVNLVECHSPYLPPRPWNDLRLPGRVLAALDAERYMNFETIVLYGARGHRIPPPALARMRHLYRRAISYMDAWLADVLEALDRRGLLDETLVIVTSDHGESFGEDGLIAHGLALSEPLIHVPLVMAGPGAVGSDAAFSLALLPGLIARAAGVPDVSPLASDMPEGIAIAQYDAIGPPDHPRILDFARRFELDDRAVARLTTNLTCATDGARKLIVREGVGESLYDLPADPDERAPLAGDPDGAFDELRAALAAVEAATGAELGPDAREPPIAGPPEIDDQERAALEQQMKLLGYL
jgi:arylsulfatase A-like enzyme